MPKAVVLLSGGLDSTTAAAVAKRDGFEVAAVSFDYGQRHKIELEAAQRVVKALSIQEHVIIRLDMTYASASALTNLEVEVPQGRSDDEIESGIPVTYVPARNLLFLAYGLSVAESIGCKDIYIGVNALDYSGYPDCRPEFIRDFVRVANSGTQLGVEGKTIRVHAPLIDLRKAEIITLGVDLGVDYGMTWSCYAPTPQGSACGECDSCKLRQKGFAQSGVADPTIYGE